MSQVGDKNWASEKGGRVFELFSAILKHFPGTHKLLYSIVEELNERTSRRTRNPWASVPPHDFIDSFLLCMDKECSILKSEFHHKNLVHTVLSLFLAGTETCSTTLCHGLLFLVKNPDVLAKIHEEINQVIGPHRIPSVDDRVKMPYTDAVIHEIQRLTDIVPMGVPHNVIRDTHFRGFLLPKGTDVFPLLGSVLKDPKYFRYPDAFYPQHFLDEQGRFKKNEAFVPFSSGKARLALGEAEIHEEINQVTRPHQVPSVDGRVKMSHKDAVIHEIQRLTNIVFMGIPHKVIWDTHFRGFLLSKVV
nr:cytochrome P450 2G1-like [Loxodonta africana]